MELVSNLPECFLKRQDSSSSPETSFQVSTVLDDLIDVSHMNFASDETWLYESPSNLNNTADELIDLFGNFKLVDKTPDKVIDTRTFTRPKKRFSRPSIEKYEELYETAVEPLQFDLMQPATNYFNLIADNNVDSFQNMSPPSLVNSLCSSTFANLMESSFIKNDPVLREIRDTDYTDSVLMHDPLRASFTESCSSLSSDTPENFLKKISYNDTFIKPGDGNQDNVNGTCKRNSKLKTTFRLSDINDKTIKFDGTFIRKKKKCDSVEDLRRDSFGSNDCNLSNSSQSSKGSNKILSMEGINAIVEMQERSLQIMSTPKPNNLLKQQLWDNNFISPIINKPSSDSELSSNDEYTKINAQKTAQSIKTNSLEQINAARKKQSKFNDIRGSYPNLQKLTEPKISKKNLKSNLNTMGYQLKGSYTSLKPVNTNLPVAPPPISAPKSLNSTTTITKEHNIQPYVRNEDKIFAKPQVRSGLPRPVSATSIPRPVSRIPAPKRTIPKTNHHEQGKFY